MKIDTLWENNHNWESLILLQDYLQESIFPPYEKVRMLSDSYSAIFVVGEPEIVV